MHSQEEEEEEDNRSNGTPHWWIVPLSHSCPPLVNGRRSDGHPMPMAHFLGSPGRLSPSHPPTPILFMMPFPLHKIRLSVEARSSNIPFFLVGLSNGFNLRGEKRERVGVSSLSSPHFGRYCAAAHAVVERRYVYVSCIVHMIMQILLGPSILFICICGYISEKRVYIHTHGA